MLSMYFRHYFLWNRVWSFIPKKLWRRFSNFFIVFSLFCCIPPLQKGIALHMNNLESPSLNDVCINMSWNWPSGSSNVIKCILSSWKSISSWSFIWTNLNPFHYRMFKPSLVEISSVVLEKKKKIRNIYRQMTNSWWTTGNQKSSLELSANRWAKKLMLALSSSEMTMNNCIFFAASYILNGINKISQF